MEYDFITDKPVRVAVHPLVSNRLAIGFMDGSIVFYTFDSLSASIEFVASKKLKKAVREISFSNDGVQLFAVSENRALCVYDVEANKRIRCIQKSHDSKVNSLLVLPASSTKGQQVATGDESGEIKMWDLRVKEPVINCYNDQEDVINDFNIAENALLAASSDGTLGAYDFRKRKIMMRSESMHCELLSLAVTPNYCYVGNGDGYLEVFKTKEYGNLLERIKTDHSLGIDCLQILRQGVLLTGSNESKRLRITHLNPHKNMGAIGVHVGGVQQLSVTSDKTWLISVGWLQSTVKFWCLSDILTKIPILRSHDIACKRIKKSSYFFHDLVNDAQFSTMQEEKLACLACASKESLNICPRCGRAYCSVKCYRCTMHQKCSESFYRECVEREIRFQKGSHQQQLITFEQFMDEQRTENMKEISVKGCSEQEILDSDDENEDYLEKVQSECLSEYQSAEERELDRQLTVLGIGVDNDSLLSSLTDEEQKSFTLFYERLLEEELGLGRSVFTKKK
ncbi:unnamed protein product [Thelazia callipaeda]|uniref:HIT-type domain-containing protein n=1 Tax=Thelazia callipaeda TaxID=103827 RepID=A0A0N5CK90_THECL|nr:unnamed protein product [Thelazia callipaeda]